jgi:putative two-component system response regulator
MQDQKVILVVDDEPINIVVLSDLLKSSYRVLVATNGEQALQRSHAEPKPDLILMDIMMPGMSGLEACQALKADPQTEDIPVIFVSAMSEEMDETQGLAVGAIDYITKPISPAIVSARVKNHLELQAARKKLKQQNSLLEEQVQERTQEVQTTRDISILALASLAETRDNETGAHILRTQRYVKALALELRKNPKYTDQLGDDVIDLLFKSAPLHDIGKVGIPDAILLKPGKLTDEEFAIMKTHASLGSDAILKAEADLGDRDTSFLRFAREIAHSHHEKWDGSGYPGGLSGDEIPLSGRLMAVADVYDALISARVYKPAFSHEKAHGIILEGRGGHFDPEIIDAYLAIESEFRQIASDYSD